MLNSAKRQNYVQRMLRENGHVTVSELSEQLNVSEVTIRKDLNHLEENDMLIRTHGGAILPDRLVYDRPFEEKADQNKELKRRIGNAAADHISNKDTMFIDAGTTTTQIVYNLEEYKDITIITNAVNIAMEAMKYNGVDIFMLGGTLRSNSASVVGPFAENMIKQHACSKLFLGVDGFDIDHGLTTTHPMEAKVNQLMIDAVERTIVVSDFSKFGRRGLSRICSVDAVDHVITDDKVPQEVVKYLQDASVSVEVV